MAKNWLAAVLCAFAGLLPAAAAAEHVVKVIARASDCRRVVAHVASADVEYRPGVDVRGRKVAPADLGGGSPIKLPDEIAFDIKVNLRNFLGGPDADACAASAAVTAADKAAAAAVTGESATVAAAAAEAQTISNTTSATAATGAADSIAANSARTKAFTDAARIGGTLGEPVIGRVRIKGSKVNFNDRLLGDAAEADLARKYREMLHRTNRRN